MFYGTMNQEILPLDENALLDMPLDEFYIATSISEGYVEDFDILEEGANIEITKKCRSFYKEYKQHIKGFKSAIKNGNKSEAKSELKAAKKELENFKKEVENMDSSAGSAIFGFFASALVLWAKDAAFLFGNFGVSFASSAATSHVASAAYIQGFLTKSQAILGIIGSIGLKVTIVASWIYSMYNIVVNIIKIVNSIDNGDSAADALNMYRVQMLKVCDKFEKQLDKLEKQL